jgi:hypothetical protein
MLIILPDGAVARVHIIDSGTADSAIQQATQLTMVIMENGHAYLIPDTQMANGKMMSDDISDTCNPYVAADTQSHGAQFGPLIKPTERPRTGDRSIGRSSQTMRVTSPRPRCRACSSHRRFGRQAVLSQTA